MEFVTSSERRYKGLERYWLGGPRLALQFGHREMQYTMVGGTIKQTIETSQIAYDIGTKAFEDVDSKIAREGAPRRHSLVHDRICKKKVGLGNYCSSVTRRAVGQD